MSNPEQIPLFEMDADWRKEWQDMPEFTQEDKEPYQRITINFSCRSDVVKFSQLINQNITSKTDSLWFPKQEWIPPKTMVYADES